MFLPIRHSTLLLTTTDRKHKDALGLTRRFHGQVITTDWVLLELASYWSVVPKRTNFLRVLATIRNAQDHTVIACDKTAFEAGIGLYAARNDKSWSLVDCISFQVMEQRKIVDAWTTDHHFMQAGFQAQLV